MFVFAIIGIAGLILYSVYGGNVEPNQTVLQPASGYVPPPDNNPVVNNNESYSPPEVIHYPASVSSSDHTYNINGKLILR